jgi:transcriptional regulator with XRE-family HTH domain
MYNPQKSANIIKLQAKKQKISVNQLLLNCNLGKSTITKMSNGTDILTQNFQKIAENLDCSVDYLLGRTDIPQVVNLPKQLLDTLVAEYNENTDEFISDDFIKEPPKSLIGQKYCFNASDYEKYQHIFDVAYKYAKENNMDILEVTGVDKEKYTDMVEYHNDIIEQIFTGKYYTFNDMSAYNKFREIYKLYTKAYIQNLLDNK